MDSFALRAIRAAVTPRPVETAPAAAPGRAAGRSRRGRTRPSGPRPRQEALLVLALVAVAVVVRRPWVVLGHPLSVEEGWLAAAVRTPLRLAAEVTSTAPLGWTLLLRLLPAGGAPERLRLLPLALAAAAVIPAYLLGRLALRAAPVVGGLVAGLAVALAPSLLARSELRHDTAEALAAVVLVLAAARLERHHTRRRLAALVVAGAVCALLAHTAGLVLAAVVAVLALVAVHESAWRRLSELLAAGVLGVGAAWVLYGWVAAPSAHAARAHWEPAMVPVTEGSGYAVTVVAQRTMLELERAGFGPWPLALPAVALGVVALWRSGLRTAAAAVPAVWLGLLAGGLTGRYPFLQDLDGRHWSVRTSLGLSLLLTLTAAVGVTWAVAGLWRQARAAPARQPPGPVRRPVPGAAAVALAAAGVFATAVGDVAVGSPPPDHLAGQDVRAQVAFVHAHRQPGDAVVVEPEAAYAFAAYWPRAPRTVPAPGHVVRYRLVYPERTGVFTQEWPHSFGRRRVWVVGTPGQTPEPPPAWLRVRDTRRPLPGSPLRLLLVGPKPRSEMGQHRAARPAGG